MKQTLKLKEKRPVKKIQWPLLLLMVIVMIIGGCQNGNTPLEPNYEELSSLALYALPDGAVFESATLHVNVAIASSKTVTAHQITDSWGETTVTWTNFNAAFNGSVEGSLFADATGWYSITLTDLVGGWLNGTIDNYGVLLDQSVARNPITVFYSRESTISKPYLEICYTLDDEPFCDWIIADADAYISERAPDTNYGLEHELITGAVGDTGPVKQALLWFDLEITRELAGIGDTVWIDEDIDGIQDAGEPPFPGVTVNLYDCLDNFIGTTVTDENGFYMFGDLTPGDYYVEFIKPEGYDITLQDQGADDAVDSDADPATGIAACTNLEPGEYDMTWDCGLYLMEMEGCSLTIGFWKTHAGFGPQADVVTPLLPIWLGTAGGAQSINVTNALIAYNILIQNVYGEPSNGITKLYAQMLGAKLNIANGADGSAIASTIALADAFLATHYYTSWDSLSKADKWMVNNWKSTFDDYNNGDIGPGHCD